MSFHNGIPIATVNVGSSVSMPTDGQSRRRADESARPNTVKAADVRLHRK
jgi:hypothetical protein